MIENSIDRKKRVIDLWDCGDDALVTAVFINQEMKFIETKSC